MRASSIKRSLGVDLTNRIKESRVLLVGAGGIGCELLKNLVLTGFGEVHIIDLDTIDLSNLNRQFLFRHEHIKKPKALVAKEVAHHFQPGAKLEAYHANIMDSQFNVGWFKTFDMVFNALDNLAARRHVNRMCLAAGVPLIESGTTGFNGQVQVIEKGKTECYDCNPKETPKSYPICTIRSTPTQPIHCIVWAKSYLLPELFGVSEDEAVELDTTENTENAKEIANLRKEAEALKEIRQSMGSDDFVKNVFGKVFETDIKRLCEMDDMWKERQAPEALEYDKLQESSASIEPTISKCDQRAWSLEENLVVFTDSLNRLSKRLRELQAKKSPEDSEPILTFDKDDEDTLDFVTSTANLRAEVFHIDLQSKFDTKQMAGNIIPAIATTNAMTASLCVLQAFKVLQGDLSHAKMVFLERSGPRAINSEALRPPNPDCQVCSVVRAEVAVDSSATLQDLVEGVLQQKLGYTDEFSMRNDDDLIYDPDEQGNLSKRLSELGIGNNCLLTVADDDDVEKDPRVVLELEIIERTEPSTDGKHVVLQKSIDIPRRPKKSILPEHEDAPTTNGTGVTGKRKREGEEEPFMNGHVAKRVAAGSAQNGDDAVIIDLDEPSNQGGAIMIDDD
ncbi:Ubiquitin-activating enzyme E1-like [Penicillium canariense]|uniref:Ubiquitin-activating enzyme E1-like n=1 Tax=Penicillium canariense TaxID=189055 RepID=A0A9W9HWI2_9EURO|nr:Ubiquitin-activating enzyme E1-like [Penicillium canariense]KAJ5159519.1 Ubiquitin-activating enzyme E1-like [Penicillium canariense]